MAKKKAKKAGKKRKPNAAFMKPMNPTAQLAAVIEFFAIVSMITMLSWVFGYVYVMTGGGPGGDPLAAMLEVLGKREHWGSYASREPADNGKPEEDAAARNFSYSFTTSSTAPTSGFHASGLPPAGSVTAKLWLAVGKVGAEPVSRWLMLAYDDLYSIQYMRKNLRPYWRRNGDDAAALLKKAAADYESLKQRCEKFDAELMADLRKIGEEKFYNGDTKEYSVFIAYEIKKNAMFRFMKKQARVDKTISEKQMDLIDKILDELSDGHEPDDDDRGDQHRDAADEEHVALAGRDRVRGPASARPALSHRRMSLAFFSASRPMMSPSKSTPVGAPKPKRRTNA